MIFFVSTFDKLNKAEIIKIKNAKGRTGRDKGTDKACRIKFQFGEGG
jgi:hypothetical protein